jgi:hypothetical protein
VATDLREASISSENTSARVLASQVATDEKTKMPSARPGKPTENSVHGSQVTIAVDGALTSRFSRTNIEMDFRPVLVKLWQDLSFNYRG